MHLIDEQYTKTLYYGAPQLTAWFLSKGHIVNPIRVERLMRKMGLAAIYPSPRPPLRAKLSFITVYKLKPAQREMKIEKLSKCKRSHRESAPPSANIASFRLE
jgi:hypothetical protein